LLSVTTFNSWAQSPSVLWEKNYGGTQTEAFTDMIPTTDGGYVLLGATESHDNDIPANVHSGVDIFVVKINSTGTLQWARSIGGNGNETGYAMVEDADGDIVIVGDAYSANQDFMMIPFAGGGKDVVVISLNSDGTIEWQKRYGGSGEDGAKSIQKIPGGGYIIAGSTDSPDDYDVSGMHYYNGTASTNDFWVLKLDASGDLVWQDCYGGGEDETTFGPGQDFATNVQNSESGGFIICGYTQSADGDITTALGANDFWVLKTDGSGNILWQKSFGGSGDDKPNSFVVVNDGYLIAGTTSSANGDVNDNHSFGGYDGWIVKLDFNGNIVDKRALGGTGSDYVYGISKTIDGGFLISGGSRSTADDCEGNYGLRDFWTVKLNSTLDIVWKRNLGDALMEEAYRCMETIDGGYIAGGYTENNPNLTSGGTYGVVDLWVVKFGTAGVGVEDNSTASFEIYPNPTTDFININGIAESSKMIIFNQSGMAVRTTIISQDNQRVDLAGLAKGMYMVMITDSKGTSTNKLIIQ